MSESGEIEENNTGCNGGSSGFWLGVILGGVVGAAIAYLATDDKSQLRKNLIKKGRVLLEHWDDFKEDAERSGRKIEKKVAAEFEDVKEEVQGKVEEIPEVAQEAVENVQEEADKAIANIVKTADTAEIQAHQKARKFFLSKGKPLVKN